MINDLPKVPDFLWRQRQIQPPIQHELEEDEELDGYDDEEVDEVDEYHLDDVSEDANSSWSSTEWHAMTYGGAGEEEDDDEYSESEGDGAWDFDHLDEAYAAILEHEEREEERGAEGNGECSDAEPPSEKRPKLD